MSSIECTYRAPTADDLVVVLADWLKSHWGWVSENNGPTVFGERISSTLYYPQQKRLIGKLLRDGLTLIASDPEDTHRVRGWIVVSNARDVLHYVYVRHVWRRLGIARALLASSLPTLGLEATACTHTGRAFPALASKYRLAFNPYAAWL